ncbi:two-component system response regulator [Gynuella sp.]|uniref:two-component system response regulator n=1 Tax=Gynuella sp. TaxID=2969146 RepID=UPI003D12B391
MLFSASRENRVNLLVVDDEPANLLILEEALKGFGNIITTIYSSEVEELAERYQPAVVLLDIEMPIMDGFEVCRRLKKNPITQDSAVIFITSHSQSEFEYHSLSQGGIDFISKPLDMQLCQLRVKNQIMLQQHAKALKEAREDLNDLVSHLPVFISFWSSEWENLFCNDFQGQWFGMDADTMVGQDAAKVLPRPLLREILQELAHNSSDAAVFSVHLPDFNEGIEDIQVYLSAKYNDTELSGFLLTLVDVTEINRTKRSLFLEKEHLKVTLNSIGDAVIATDVNAVITFMNPIAERMTGWMSRKAIGRDITDIMNLKDAYTQQNCINPLMMAIQEKRIVAMALNSQLTSIDGVVYRVEDSAAPIFNEKGDVIGGIIVFHDVSETVAMAVKMSYLANHDQLTDLPNRILLHDRIIQACQIAESHSTMVALFLIDIDHFKYLNDSLGHHHGDVLIKQVAKRLQTLVDVGSTLARTGGDEFVLVVPDIESPGIIDTIATSIIQCMQQPFAINQREYTLTVSIGISVNPTDARSESGMMRHADVAMYRAKQHGRNGYCFFSHDLETDLLKRHEVELLLRDTLEHDRLEVYFQPQYDLRTRQINGAEALVRMRDKHGQLISPLQFIPLAEETGLINQLGLQVLNKSCLAAKKWADMGHSIRVSVNVAAKQFANINFWDEVATALEATQLPSRLLELELTESALMHDFDKTRGILEELSELGLSIAIDDFGTGYSSLSYLKAFPIDVLKIDQSFVKDMLNDKQSENIVKTIIHLANSLELKLIGEGIEYEQQLQRLLEMGCETGQGYLFSKPITEREMTELLMR